MATYKLSIPAIKCGGCVSSIEGTVSALSKVDSVVVDLESKQATVNGDIELATLMTALADSGFPAEKL